MAQRSPLAMTGTDNTSVEGVVAIYNGTIGVDSARFPSGIAALSSYIHARGLKMGLYTAQCSTTCQFRPGSYEHEALDASTFCEWGADYLKIDQCGGPCHAHLNTSWQLFREALDKCASSRNRSAITMACSRYVRAVRPPPDSTLRTSAFQLTLFVVLHSCGDPDGCGKWIKEVGCNLWRTSGDIQATWGSIMGILDHNNAMAPVQAPGYYNVRINICIAPPVSPHPRVALS